mgnify:CR=1 FL=1
MTLAGTAIGAARQRASQENAAPLSTRAACVCVNRMPSPRIEARRPQRHPLLAARQPAIDRIAGVGRADFDREDPWRSVVPGDRHERRRLARSGGMVRRTKDTSVRSRRVPGTMSAPSTPGELNGARAQSVAVPAAAPPQDVGRGPIEPLEELPLPRCRERISMSRRGQGGGLRLAQSPFALRSRVMSSMITAPFVTDAATSTTYSNWP